MNNCILKLVVIFDYFRLMRPSFSSVDFGYIHAARDFPAMNGAGCIVISFPEKLERLCSVRNLHDYAVGR